MKVLFVITLFPLPPYAGAKIAALETLRSIEGLCELHILAPQPESDSEKYIAELQQILPNTKLHLYQPRESQRAPFEKYSTAALTAFSGRSYHASIWLDKNLRRSAQELCHRHDFDVVHCEWVYPAIALRGLSLPIVVRTLDLHFAIMRDGLHGMPDSKRVRKSLWKVEVERFRRFEVAVLNEAQLAITVSAEDEETLRREGVHQIVRIPPPMSIPAQVLSAQTSKPVCNALFLCMLHAMVNRESSFLFTDQIWPRVSEQIRSRVNVIFAGGNPDAEARHRAAECGIEMHAPLSVEEARRLYDESDIFISPIKTGTGIKTKTLEAMAHGKPMIGFRNSFRGIPIENGKHALIADSNEEFARLFEMLVADTNLRQRIGVAAREFIDVNFNPKTLGAQLINAYAEAISTAKYKLASHIR